MSHDTITNTVLPPPSSTDSPDEKPPKEESSGGSDTPLYYYYGGDDDDGSNNMWFGQYGLDEYVDYYYIGDDGERTRVDPNAVQQRPNVTTTTTTTLSPLPPAISHTHYNDSIDVAALKARVKYLGNNTYVRTKRQVGEIVGILDLRSPILFRVAGFTPITLSTFTILSTGTAGKKESVARGGICVGETPFKIACHVRSE